MVGSLIEGRKNCYICEECIGVCNELIREEREEAAEEIKAGINLMTPAEIKEEYPLPAEEHLPVEDPFPREEPLPVEGDPGLRLGFITLKHPERLAGFLQISIPGVRGAARGGRGNTPKTGDPSGILLWAVIHLCSVFILLRYFGRRRRS